MPRPSEPVRRRRPTGRRAGDSGTRDAILDAALVLFAERGYDGASLRAIADAAGVDPALIRHYFTDKQSLFATTVADRTAIPQRLAAALEGDPAALGARFADAYLRVWEEPDTRAVLLALVRSATTSPRVADMLQQILGRQLSDRTGNAGPDGPLRLALAASHLFGLAVARHIIKLAPIATLDHDALVATVAPTIQHYLGKDATAGRG